MSNLDPMIVDAVLRGIISDLDYDLHKNLECDEETEIDVYPALVQSFISEYTKLEQSA